VPRRYPRLTYFSNFSHSAPDRTSAFTFVSVMVMSSPMEPGTKSTSAECTNPPSMALNEPWYRAYAFSSTIILQAWWGA